MKKSMRNPSEADFLALFREFASLEKRRGGPGVTPLEFQRWNDLKRRLGRRFEQRGVGKAAKPRPSCLRIEFTSPREFADCQLAGLTSGDGMFINTPFAVRVGRSFLARVLIASTGGEIVLRCAVVSANVANDHTTTTMGMGVRFTQLSDDERAELRVLRGAAVDDESTCEGGSAGEVPLPRKSAGSG